MDKPMLTGKDPATYYASTTAFARSFADLAAQHRSLGTIALIGRLLLLTAMALDASDHSGSQPLPTLEEGAERVAAILRQLRWSDLEEITVKELARKCGCSRRHLTRVFHSEFGCSISAHKMELRLEKAADLLLNTNWKTIAVANACGFIHLGQFSTKFKEKYGATPSKWRQIVSQNPHLKPFAEQQLPDLELIAL